jgi:hypothetical protein
VIEFFSPWNQTLARHLYGDWTAPKFPLDIYADAWSPIWAGVTLGLLQIPTFFLLDQNIAVSGSYVSVAGYFFRLTVPNTFERMPYLKNFYGTGDFGQV